MEMRKRTIDKMDLVLQETNKDMLLVLIATIPSFVVSIYIFGARAALVTISCVFFAILLDALFNFFTKSTNDQFEISSIITGIILSFLLPANIPFHVAFVGCFFSIIVVKKLFGGLGQNIVNPAAAGLIFLWFAFPAEMKNLPQPNIATTIAEKAALTPVQLWTTGRFEELPSYLEQFLGFVSGGLGEVSLIAILIGGIFLMIKKVINPIVPGVYILTVAIVSFFWGADPIFQCMTASLYFGAFFLMSDPATTPKTLLGKIIYAFVCGILTMLIRIYGVFTDGVLISILIMNILTPYIEKFEHFNEKEHRAHFPKKKKVGGENE